MTWLFNNAHNAEHLYTPDDVKSGLMAFADDFGKDPADLLALHEYFPGIGFHDIITEDDIVVLASQILDHMVENKSWLPDNESKADKGTRISLISEKIIKSIAEQPPRITRENAQKFNALGQQKSSSNVYSLPQYD